MAEKSRQEVTNSEPVSVHLRKATDRVLVFLSNATNETLGACLAGLGATTYFVFGRLGLVLIGVVGGVVLHAHWEAGGGSQDDSTRLKETARRREVGLDVVQRVLGWQDARRQGSGTSNIDDEVQLRSSDYSDFKPETAAALNSLTDAIIRDYVKWWYSPILPTEIAFPSACRQTLTSFILALSNHLARKRPADTFLEFTTNSSSIVIVFLTELSSALSASPSSSPQDALKTYLRLKPDSNLANILDQKHQQRKLRMIADDILEKYLDSNVYRCSAARIFLREVLANTILDMTIQKCSRPEWINDWIVYLLEEGEPEIMNAIDAGVENAGGQKALEEKRKEVLNEEIDTKSPTSEAAKIRQNHKRTVSRAEEAMDEAMKEAQRLTQLIIEEDQRRQNEQSHRDSSDNNKDQPDSSKAATNGFGTHTPMSSQDLSEVDPHHAFSVSTSVDERSPTTSVSASPPPSVLTSFEQLPADKVPDTLVEDAEPQKGRQQEPFTLHKAKVQIFDDGLSGAKNPPKQKPTNEYMIQIEPASAAFPGWMIPRTYVDFETLHEILRRIANVSGVPFAKVHPELPSWRSLNKLRLRDELDRYLHDSLQYEQLAESEGMKRFLEKERGFRGASGSKAGFWPNPAQMGKGMFDALTKAPIQVAGGGKALIGGVANAFTGQKATAGVGPLNPKRASMSSTADGRPALMSSSSSSRMSFDALRKPMASSTSPLPPHPARLSSDTRRSSSSTINSVANAQNGQHIPAAINDQLEALAAADQPRRRSDTPEMQLPPPPDIIPDDYASPTKPKLRVPEHTSQMSVDGTSFFDVPTPTSQASREVSPRPPSSRLESPRGRVAPKEPVALKINKQREHKVKQPLSEQEAQVTVELLFAVINELYTLSSAWNIRRTLLTAAKSFLLRPGNPQLESIRILMQESVIDANTSDSGLGAHLLKLRENSLPTEEELKLWPPPPTDDEKEALRKKARKLLIARGMPQALTSVMGAAASGEALGRVFDCLQVEEVARGIMFGLLLQGVRAVTQ